MWECGWCGRNRRPDGRSGVAGDAIPGRRVRARVGGRTWRSSRRLKPRSKSWARILFHLNGALVGRDGQTDRPGLARWLAGGGAAPPGFLCVQCSMSHRHRTYVELPTTQRTFLISLCGRDSCMLHNLYFALKADYGRRGAHLAVPSVSLSRILS